MLKVVICAAMAVALGAATKPAPASSVADRSTAAARKALNAKLIDFPSARFRDVRGALVPKGGGWLYCGYVNSKNRMGGYTGWTQVMIDAGPANASITLAGDSGDNMIIDVVCQKPADYWDGKDHSDDLTFR